MKISRTTFATCALLVFGCDRQPVEQRHMEEQQELTREQAAERRELTKEQMEEQQRAQRRAQEALRGETEDLREERADVAREARDVSALMTRACQGVPEANFDKCPIDARNVTGVRDIDEGVEIQMSAAAGTEREVQRRVDCYEARHEIRAAGVTAPTPATVAGTPTVPPAPLTPMPPQNPRTQPRANEPGANTQTAPMMCVLDFATIDIDVDDGDNGRIDVQITSEDDGRVNELRQLAHQLTQRQASLR